ncbi:hypothetical protein KR044_002777 [Drosophila immigrans]|nr:hypothetical protein KR044_002777 [Drosophila immigrans]
MANMRSSFGILLLMLSTALAVESQMKKMSEVDAADTESNPSKTETTHSTSTTEETTSTTASSTTASQSDTSKLLNHLIEHVLATSKTGHYVGNEEFDQQSTLLRIVSHLGDDQVKLKQHAYEKFVSYNALRLKLEGDLANKLAVVDNYFHSEPLSDACKVYYRRLKHELLIARTETNSLKVYKLNTFDLKCPHKHESADEHEIESESDEDYDSFWDIWNSILG